MNTHLLEDALGSALAMLPTTPSPSLAQLNNAAHLSFSSIEQLDLSPRAVVLAGAIAAHLRLGERAAARDLADHAYTYEAQYTESASPLDRSLFWAALSEAYVTIGSARLAAVCAQRATRAAEASGDRRAGYVAASLLCVATALNGEYAAAEASAALAESLADASGWNDSSATYGLLVGILFLASADLDLRRLAMVSARLRALPDDPRAESTAAIGEAMQALIDSDSGRAIAVAHQIVSGMTDERVLPMVRSFAAGIVGDALLLRGAPRDALSLLADIASTPEHSVCFDMQRASAHLMLGDPLAALRVTSGCVALGFEHCPRTMAPIQLRRALAYHRLGEQARADAEFEEAFLKLMQSGSHTPLLTLPQEELNDFLLRYRRSRPEDAPQIHRILKRMAAVPGGSSSREAQLPALTPREQEVAWKLRETGSAKELARASFVSPNTVKAQLRSLYAKLGVSSRAGALEVLQVRGFYDKLPPDARRRLHDRFA